MENKKYLLDHLGILPTTVDSVFEFIMSQCNTGEIVEFRKFGVFKSVMRQIRNARNPKTGESVLVPKHKTIVFNPSPIWIKELNEGTYINHDIRRLQK